MVFLIAIYLFALWWRKVTHLTGHFTFNRLAILLNFSLFSILEISECMPPSRLKTFLCHYIGSFERKFTGYMTSVKAFFFFLRAQWTVWSLPLWLLTEFTTWFKSLMCAWAILLRKNKSKSSQEMKKIMNSLNKTKEEHFGDWEVTSCIVTDMDSKWILHTLPKYINVSGSHHFHPFKREKHEKAVF